MKTVVAYFCDPEPLGYPFNYTEFLASYQALTRDCQRENIRLCIARTQASYLGHMKFKSGWEFQDEKLVEIPEEITADLIYMRSRREALETTPGDKVLNDIALDEICRDKMATYALFAPLMKKCVVIDANSWKEKIAGLDTPTIVLKPTHGESGEGIFFSPKDTFTFDQIPAGNSYLAQEFLDASAGVPGVMQGVHDLRLVMANGNPVVSYLRIAKEGSLLSNTVQGASVMPITLEQVPAECFPIAQKIDGQLSHFPYRMYSIDFMFENGKPYVTELNSRPGLPDASWIGEERAQRFRDAVITVFKQA
jgi:glutathione synthase/RimK-type ligase-like ATP-grasp enzyme